MPHRAGTRRPALGSRWWQTCIAWYALLALAWPSLGPLPYIVHDFGAHLAAAGAHIHPDGDHADATGNAGQNVGGDDAHHVDASSIPGSPLHPADHDCPECEVLKHLSRCMLPVLTVDVRAPVTAAVASPPVAIARPRAQATAHLPPARAPPLAIA